MNAITHFRSPWFLLLVLAFVSSMNAKADDGPTDVAVGREITVKAGETRDSVVGIGASGTIAGRVKDLVLIGSNVTLESTAEITGDMFSVGSTINRHPNVKVAGEEVNVGLPWNWNGANAQQGTCAWRWCGLGFRLWRAVSSFILVLLLGWAYLHFFPGFHARTLEQLGKNLGPSFGAGLVGFIASPMVVMLLIISILGILLVPFYLAAYAVLLGVGHFAGAYFAAGKLFARLGNAKVSPLLGTAILLGVLHLIPFAGCFVGVILTMMGFGAVLRALVASYGAKKSR